MNAIQTATVNENIKIDMVLCSDGKYRWFAGNDDTEVSGATIEEAQIAAQNAWSDIVF
jgi:hypothetical protein